MAVSFATLSSQLACLVLSLGAFGPATNANEIPADCHKIPALNVAYKVHTEGKAWAEAKETCIEEGARLAVIDTMLKVQEVAALNANICVWVGIRRTGEEAPWRSAGNNFLMSGLPWGRARYEPLGRQNCLAIRPYNRGLTNENCLRFFGSVCEITLVEHTNETAPR